MYAGPTRYLPHVALATFLVVGLPALIVSALQRTVDMPAAVAILLAVALSLVFSRLGTAVWMRRPGSRDIVFGDLMVWGWLRRMRVDRRLAEAERLLGDDELSAGRRGELLRSLAAGLEARDSYTAGHSGRVARHAEAIAREMGLRREEVAKVRAAAAVHDVGKIRTPRAILTKPGRLTDGERAVMETHAREGAGMVAALGDPDITAMVEFHHERLDGSGYPDGLSGADIPLGARIIAVADTFDAMTSSRPYRSGERHKRALDVLSAESPQRLDPRAVAAFRRHYSGERAVPVSAFLAAIPQRVGNWLAGLVQGEGALPLAQGLSALGAAALLGGSMIGPGGVPQGGDERAGDRPAVASATPARLVDPGDTPRGGDRESGGDRRDGSAGAPGGRDRERGGATPPRGGGTGGGTGGGSGDGSPGQAPSGPGEAAVRPQQPPGQVVPPAGGQPDGPVRPTVTVTPEEVQVGTEVKVPVPPLPRVDTGVTLGLPRGQPPQVQVGLDLHR